MYVRMHVYKYLYVRVSACCTYTSIYMHACMYGRRMQTDRHTYKHKTTHTNRFKITSSGGISTNHDDSSRARGGTHANNSSPSQNGARFDTDKPASDTSKFDNAVLARDGVASIPLKMRQRDEFGAKEPPPRAANTGHNQHIRPTAAQIQQQADSSAAQSLLLSNGHGYGHGQASTMLEGVPVPERHGASNTGQPAQVYTREHIPESESNIMRIDRAHVTSTDHGDHVMNAHTQAIVNRRDSTTASRDNIVNNMARLGGMSESESGLSPPPRVFRRAEAPPRVSKHGEKTIKQLAAMQKPTLEAPVEIVTATIGTFAPTSPTPQSTPGPTIANSPAGGIHDLARGVGGTRAPVTREIPPDVVPLLVFEGDMPARASTITPSNAGNTANTTPSNNSVSPTGM
jgi:hypothetical protein